VSVVNFPAVQVVSGTVDVGNLPAVQEVAGTVAVGNLPLDQDGNVRVAGATSCAAAAIHFVGFTQANLDANSKLFEASRACTAEFPGARVCDYVELVESIPPPPAFPTPDAALVSFRIDAGSYDLLDIRCIRGNGEPVFNGCASINIYSLPAACCG